MEDQKFIASHIITTLDSSGLFHSVELTGSVANGKFDELSDIDILVSNPTRSPKENVELASLVIESNLGVLIKGWSLSLLPDKYLLHHFLPNIPIFWWIDIGCLPIANFSPLYRNEIKECPNAHIAKLWVMNAKHMLRGNTQRLKITELHQKVFGQNTILLTDVSAFIAVYHAIDFAKLPIDFGEGCQALLRKLKNCPNTSCVFDIRT